MKINAHFRFFDRKDTVITCCLIAAAVIAAVIFLPSDKFIPLAAVIYAAFFLVAAIAFYVLLRAAIQRDVPGNKYFRSVPGAFASMLKAWFKLEICFLLVIASGIGGGLISGMKPSSFLPAVAFALFFHALLRPGILLLKSSVVSALVAGLCGAFSGGFVAGFGLTDDLSVFFEVNTAAVCIVCAVVAISEAVSLIITYKKLPEVYNS